MQKLDLLDSLYQGFFTPERNVDKMREVYFWYHFLLLVQTYFSGLLEILKYSVEVTACLFYLDETYYCLGKIHQYCCCQQNETLPKL